MNKKNAHSRLATVAKQKGLIVQTRRNGEDADDIRILNASTRKVVASGTLKLDASRTGYDSQDVLKIIRQLKTMSSAKKAMNSSRRKLSSSRRKLNCAWDRMDPEEIVDYLVNDMGVADEDEAWGEIEEVESASHQSVVGIPSAEDTENEDAMYVTEDKAGKLHTWARGNGYWYEIPNGGSTLNSGRRRKANASKRRMNSSCHGRKRLNSADDYVGDDAEFVEDVESVVTDEQGNEIVVDDMLVVQDPETNEISLFVPTKDDDAVPENVEVIGEVTAADSEEVLDSSRKVKMKASRRKLKMKSSRRKINAAAEGEIAELKDAIDRQDYNALYDIVSPYEETVMQDVVDSLEAEGYYSEPSIQAGRGTDEIFDVDTDELVASINYEEEMWALGNALLDNNFRQDDTAKDMLNFILSYVE